MASTVPQDEVFKFIKNTKHLYNACIQNGFYLPSLKNAFVTQKLLMEVFRGECFCPKLQDMRFLPCFKPPTNK